MGWRGDHSGTKLKKNASKRLEDVFPDMDTATLILAAREKEGWTQ